MSELRSSFESQSRSLPVVFRLLFSAQKDTDEIHQKEAFMTTHSEMINGAIQIIDDLMARWAIDRSDHDEFHRMQDRVEKLKKQVGDRIDARNTIHSAP